MGLSISVGLLAYQLEHDPEAAAQLRRDLDHVNRVLADHDLPPHVEPESLPPSPGPGPDRREWLGTMPYSWIHHLRRAVAFARQAPARFGPVAPGENPATHELIDRELTVLLDSHVVCHSDGEGFYLPLDFPDPLFDDREDGVSGSIIGSSPQALRELARAAPLLGIALRDGQPTEECAAAIVAETEGSHPLWIERHAWLRFHDRLRESVATGAALVFG